MSKPAVKTCSVRTSSEEIKVALRPSNKAGLSVRSLDMVMDFPDVSLERLWTH